MSRPTETSRDWKWFVRALALASLVGVILFALIDVYRGGLGELRGVVPVLLSVGIANLVIFGAFGKVI